jgi:hypothetical protein
MGMKKKDKVFVVMVKNGKEIKKLDKQNKN